MSRTKEILGQIKGLIWEMSNTPMDKEFCEWYSEIEKAGKDLNKIAEMIKRHVK